MKTIRFNDDGTIDELVDADAIIHDLKTKLNRDPHTDFGEDWTNDFVKSALTSFNVLGMQSELLLSISDIVLALNDYLPDELKIENVDVDYDVDENGNVDFNVTIKLPNTTATTGV